jgi:hypothetical protein
MCKALQTAGQPRANASPCSHATATAAPAAMPAITLVLMPLEAVELARDGGERWPGDDGGLQQGEPNTH